MRARQSPKRGVRRGRVSRNASRIGPAQRRQLARFCVAPRAGSARRRPSALGAACAPGTQPPPPPSPSPRLPRSARRPERAMPPSRARSGGGRGRRPRATPPPRLRGARVRAGVGSARPRRPAPVARPGPPREPPPAQPWPFRAGGLPACSTRTPPRRAGGDDKKTLRWLPVFGGCAFPVC